MANRWRGEIPFPALGKDVFISFPLDDLAELEDRFGEDFFTIIEARSAKLSYKTISACLSVGLKRRNKDGSVSLIWETEGKEALLAEKFKLSDAVKPILDALSISLLQKTYDELIAEAVELQKKQDAENLKRVKEAAEEAGVPFNEALSDGLFKLLTSLGSTQ